MRVFFTISSQASSEIYIILFSILIYYYSLAPQIEHMNVDFKEDVYDDV